MSKEDLSVSLTVKMPDGSTKVFEFTSGDPIMIGSGASVQVRIEHEDVSSLHAMIKPKSGDMVVLDLGSDEGTEVNGDEIAGETPLADGDTIRVGGAEIGIHFGGEMLAPTVPIRSMPELQSELDDVKAARAKKNEIAKKAAKVKAAQDDKDKITRIQKQPVDDTEIQNVEADNADKTVRVPPPVDDTADVSVADKDEASREAKARPTPPKKKSKTNKAASAATGVVHVKKSTQGKRKPLDTDLSKEEKPVNKAHVDVTMMWGGSVMGVQRLSDNGDITIGEGDGASFNVTDSSIPSGNFAIVSLSGNGAKVNAASGMEIEIDGKKVDGSSVTLDMGQKATVKVGTLEFLVQYTQRYAGIRVPISQSLDYIFAQVFAFAMIFQVAFIAAMLITPHLSDDDDDDLNTNLNEFTELILKKEEKKKEKKEDLSGKKAARRKDDEGKFGKKDKKPKDAMASKKGAPKVDKDKREEDRKLAMDALAALGLQGPEGAVSNVLGPGGLGSGMNNALGGLSGASTGDAGGLGGMGTRGAGAGGGGNALGIGGLGSGNGRGSGGRGGVDLGGRGKGMTRVRPGKVTFKGSLSKEEIQRVIRRAKSRIRYCYEKELQKNPNLSGKIVVNWTISGTGTVSTAKASQNTMGNKSVGKCVTRVVKGLRFPKPKGGGSVFVTYPWVFSSK